MCVQGRQQVLGAGDVGHGNRNGKVLCILYMCGVTACISRPDLPFPLCSSGLLHICGCVLYTGI